MPEDSRLPPSNIEAEKAVLGSVLIDPTIYDEVEGWLVKKSVFFSKINDIIWTAMKELRKEHSPVDQISVVDKLNQMKQLERVGGAYHVTTLSEIPSTANAGYYAKLVYQTYMQRELARSSAEMQEISMSGTYNDAQQSVEEHQRLLLELQSLEPTKQRPMNDIIDDSFHNILTTDNLIPYGMKALDASASGMTRGEITVIGGRPSHGKTTLMVNIVDSLVMQGFKVMVFNREMTNSAMIEKLLTMHSNFTATQLRKKTFTQADVDMMGAHRESLKKRYAQNLIMYDDIRDLGESMREIRRYKPDVVIDDYIQLVKVNIDKKDRRFEIEEVMNEYKWMAKTLKLAPLLVSQLSREIEKRLDPKPRMSDFAEGGTIEQVAETALFVFYGYVFNHEDYDKYTSEFIFAKARYGEVMSIDVGFTGNKARFTETPVQARALDLGADA